MQLNLFNFIFSLYIFYKNQYLYKAFTNIQFFLFDYSFLIYNCFLTINNRVNLLNIVTIEFIIYSKNGIYFYCLVSTEI
jgi:hypothetical protein